MVRGRKPLATKVKDATGAHAKNPKRRNKAEPQAKQGRPEPTPVVRELPHALDCWNHVCDLLDQMGLLTTADQHLLEIYCIDYSQSVLMMKELKTGEICDINEKGTRVTKPEAIQLHRYLDRRLKTLSELGLTPSSRSRLCVNTKEEDDPLKQFLAVRSA